jgi:hypothetical protein
LAKFFLIILGKTQKKLECGKTERNNQRITAFSYIKDQKRDRHDERRHLDAQWLGILRVKA